MSKPNQDFLSKDLRILFVPSKRKKVSKVFITIEGNIVVNHISEIKKTILPAVKSYEILTISLKNVSTIDCSGIQLLHYLSKAHENVSIDSSLSEQDRRLISIAGFSELLHKPKLA